MIFPPDSFPPDLSIKKGALGPLLYSLYSILSYLLATRMANHLHFPPLMEGIGIHPLLV